MLRAILNETLNQDFVVSDPLTGAAIDADGGYPLMEVYEDGGAASMFTPVAAKRNGGATGQYTFSMLLSSGNGFEVNKRYNVYAIAAVGGAVGKSVVMVFKVEAPVIYTN